MNQASHPRSLDAPSCKNATFKCRCIYYKLVRYTFVSKLKMIDLHWHFIWEQSLCWVKGCGDKGRWYWAGLFQVGFETSLMRNHQITAEMRIDDYYDYFVFIHPSHRVKATSDPFDKVSAMSLSENVASKERLALTPKTSTSKAINSNKWSILLLTIHTCGIATSR